MHQSIGTGQPNYRRVPYLPFAIVWVGRVTGLRHFWIPGCGALLSTEPSCQPILQIKHIASVSSEPSVIVGNQRHEIPTWWGYCRGVSIRTGVPNPWDLMPNDLRWSWCNNNRIKCTINVIHLNRPQTIPPPTLVYGKIVFHETDAWCQKGWGHWIRRPLRFPLSLRMHKPRSHI